MTRPLAKCLIASAGTHALLLLILFVGPAFLPSSKPTDNNRPPIDFVTPTTIDAALSGGGSPNVRQPAPVVTPPPQAKVEAPPPTPAPPPQKVVEKVEKAEPPPIEKPAPRHIEKPTPPKVETKDPEAFDTKPVKKKPQVDLTKQIVRPKNPTPKKPTPRVEPEDDTEAQAEAAATARRNRIASALNSATSDLRTGISAPTTIKLSGPGGGGVPYANFMDAVKKAYDDAWIVPDGVTDDRAVATASVTIGRDGTVLNARLIQRSGSPLADQSVEMVLRRVTFAAPLPPGAKESQRTVEIKFNVSAKKGTG